MIQQLHPITRLQKAGVKRPIEEELLSRKKIKSKFMVFKSSCPGEYQVGVELCVCNAYRCLQ